MKGNLMLFRACLYISFIMCSITNAQTFKSAGENEFRKSRKQGYINLEFDLKSSFNTRSYSQVLMTIIDDELGEIGMALRGYYPISGKTSLRFQLPYSFKFGLVPCRDCGRVGRLLGKTDFETNWGLGDLHTTFLWNIIQQQSSRKNLSVQTDLIFPTGESRFSNSFKGEFPMGNGFTLLHFGMGFSKKISSKNLFFANTGYIIRFSRTIEDISYKPDNSGFVNAGIGFINKYDHSINLEVEYNWVGADIEKAYQVARYGVSAKTPSAFSWIFIGFEHISLKGFGTGSVFEFNLPIRFKIFGIKL